MESVAKIQDEIISEFIMFTDWSDKYEYLIGLGRSVALIKKEYKIDENLIKGCQSKVWLHATFNKKVVLYTADSDAIITKGIVGLMLRVFSNQTPNSIINANLSFIDNIGLKEHLSPTRANGLMAMVKQIKFYAIAFNQTTSKT